MPTTSSSHPGWFPDAPLTEGRVYRWTVADADDDLTANAARALARLLDESGLHRRGANVAQHYPSHVASDTANVVEDLLSLTPGAIAALSPEQSDLAVTLFQRFDAEYTGHAQREAEFLRALGTRLSSEQQKALVEILNVL